MFVFFFIGMSTQEHEIYQTCLKGCMTEEERQRVNYEWAVMKDTGMMTTLRKVKDFRTCLVGPFFLRGSAGGSLILHLLGFTPLHPLKHGFSFERFLHHARDRMGDIDVDVSPRYREQIFAHLRDLFPGQVGRLSNREKSALQQYRTHHHLPRNHVFTSDQIKTALTHYEGKFRFFSRHVGGICWTEKKQSTTVESRPTEPLPRLAMDKHDVHREKKFKIDLLNNHALAFLESIGGHAMDASTVNQDDEATWTLLQKGDTLGILYAESPLMRQCLTTIQPRSLAELALCFSLIRPMNRRTRHRLEKDPSFADRVKTMQDPYFDDDWIEWLAEQKKVTRSEADVLRRRIANDPEDPRIKGYGFCRSHAFHYALLIYQMAWKKTHEPLLFFKALLEETMTSSSRRMYRPWVYTIDAMNHSIRLLDAPPRRGHPRGRRILWNIHSSTTLIPKGGIQSRFRRQTSDEQIRDSGVFTYRSNEDLLRLDGWVACSTKVGCHLFMTYFSASSRSFQHRVAMMMIGGEEGV